MRIVLDTNVFVSGVFFGGVPGRILDAWRDARVRLVLSAEILAEYQRVGQVLGAQYLGVDLEPFLGLLTVQAEIVEAPDLPEPVSFDPDNDKWCHSPQELPERSFGSTGQRNTLVKHFCGAMEGWRLSRPLVQLKSGAVELLINDNYFCRSGNVKSARGSRSVGARHRPASRPRTA